VCPNIRFVCVYLCIWGCILPFSYTAKINVSKGDRSLMAETHFVFIVIWWGCNGMKMMNKQTDNKLFKRSLFLFLFAFFHQKMLHSNFKTLCNGHIVVYNYIYGWNCKLLQYMKSCSWYSSLYLKTKSYIVSRYHLFSSSFY